MEFHRLCTAHLLHGFKFQLDRLGIAGFKGQNTILDINNLTTQSVAVHENYLVSKSIAAAEKYQKHYLAHLPQCCISTLSHHLLPPVSRLYVYFSTCCK